MVAPKKAGQKKNPNVSAFSRWMADKVGQNWNALYKSLGEQPELVRFKNVEVLSAVVAHKSSVKDGKTRLHTARGVVPLEESMVPYYVNAEGLVCKNEYPAKLAAAKREAAQKAQAELAARVRTIDDEHLLVKKGTDWVIVEMAVMGTDARGEYDAFLCRRVYANIWSDMQELLKTYGVKNMYCKAVMQLTPAMRKVLQDQKLLA